MAVYHGLDVATGYSDLGRRYPLRIVLLLAFLTLPVEFNASARASKLLVSHGIIQGDEQIAGVEKVLGAAAWTYVAAAVSAIGVWLFYVFILFFRGGSEARHR